MAHGGSGRGDLLVFTCWGSVKVVKCNDPCRNLAGVVGLKVLITKVSVVGKKMWE